ncbi:MAG: hypothetical protein ACJ8DZ_07355 [Allosphingosinicella sp.]
MTKLFLAALLAASMQSAAASATVPIQPSVDTPEERQALQSLLACLVAERPRWARETLALPYLSGAQANSAAEVLSGRDTCLKKRDAAITFRTSSVVAMLAEHFLRTDLPRVDFGRVKAALSSVTAQNGSEDFGLCVASRDPGAARDLALSAFGSDAELQAARQLADQIEPCTTRGEALTVDLQALRALVSTALYRSVTTALAARN